MADLLPDLKRDREEVDQFGFVNLHDVFTNGVIDGDFNVSDESYNRIPPDCVLPRPDDYFAGVRQKKYVQESLRAASESAKKAAENAS